MTNNSLRTAYGELGFRLMRLAEHRGYEWMLVDSREEIAHVIAEGGRYGQGVGDLWAVRIPDRRAKPEVARALGWGKHDRHPRVVLARRDVSPRTRAWALLYEMIEDLGYRVPEKIVRRILQHPAGFEGSDEDIAQAFAWTQKVEQLAKRPSN